MTDLYEAILNPKPITDPGALRRVLLAWADWLDATELPKGAGWFIRGDNPHG